MQSVFRVLPILDTDLGVIQLRINRRWHRFLCPAPAALHLALARAVGPAEWNPMSRTLAIRVPRTGSANGKACAFVLEPLNGSDRSASTLTRDHAAILIG
ncbi:hypothetical protein [Paeniglutamicibacter cryotolerans]|uniref:Uncharacterized protein n=1 Tax=Paeniglutamicibacter cryotolerans TaxID=670079 RepID=A0A839QIN0_9MICC|nr:hypothetical protein [Paeniglutamicibacter cryotolerans]MBB2995463.1 hypothetical protein [Paeniglutamicibacter cryotolerans]